MQNGKTFKTLIASATVFGASMTMLSVPAKADINIDGATCMAANLNQALNLGLSLSQFGAGNLQPLSGASFFMVCPVVITSDEVGTTNFTIGVEFLHPLAHDVVCSMLETDGREVESSSGGFTVPNNGGNPGGVDFNVAFDPGYSFNQDSLSVVCNMPPQTRINYITLDGA